MGWIQWYFLIIDSLDRVQGETFVLPSMPMA